MAINLDAELERLKATQLVKGDEDREPSLAFRHVLTQETAYSSLLLARRRALHGRVAQAYERLYPSRLDDLSPILAHHYREALDYARTLEYATKAGDSAARTWSNLEAIEYYSLAPEAANRVGASADRLTRLYLARGRIFELSGRYEEALANYRQMGEGAAGSGDRAGELAALLARGQFYVTPNPVQDAGRAKTSLDRALGMAVELQDHAAEARIYWLLLLLNKWTSHVRAAVEYGEKAVALCRQYNLREQLAFVLNDIALHAYLENGELRKCRECLVEALGLWQELDNLPMQADSLGNLALLEAGEGNFPRVISLGDQMRAIARRTGNLWTESYSHFAEGEAYAAWGDVGTALEGMEECIQLGSRAGFTTPALWVRSIEALLYGEMGDLATAIELARRAVGSGKEFWGIWNAWPHAVLVRLELQRGNTEAAQAEWLASGLGAKVEVLSDALPPVMCGIALARGALALALGDGVTARRVADRLVARLSEIGARAWLPQALLFQASVIPKPETSQRWEVLDSARVVAEELQARLYLWRILFEESEIQAQLGRAAEARSRSERASALVAYIADRSPAGLKESFLQMSAVKGLREEVTADVT